MTQQFIQPQRQPIGSFRSPNGVEVPVTITVPWFRALNQLFQQVNSNTDSSNQPPAQDITIDGDPAFQFGALYYASGPTSLRRLPRPDSPNQVLYGLPSGAPFWGDLPDTPTPDLNTLLCDDQGRLLLDEAGFILLDA